MSSKVKDDKVSWNIIYDFVYVPLINIGHSMQFFWYIGLNRPNWTFMTLKRTFKMNQRH